MKGIYGYISDCLRASSFRLVLLTFVITGCASTDHKKTPSTTPPIENLITSCGKTPFSMEFGGINTKVAAQLSSDALPALKEFTDSLNSAAGDVSAEVNLFYARKTTNLLITSAYRQVVENYFCYLKKTHPQNLEVLSVAEANFYQLINDIFDKSLYEGSYIERQEKRSLFLTKVSSKGSDIVSAHSIPISQLPNPDFTTFNVVQIDAILNTAGLGEVYGCMGAKFGSIANIDERALSGLQTLRSDLLMYLEGSYKAEAAVSNIISTARQIYDSPKTTPNLTVTDVTCLKSIAAEISDSVKP